MNPSTLLRLMGKAKQAGSLAGALAFAFLVWFAGPMIGFGASRPLESVGVRLLVIILVLGAILGWEGWRYYQRRRKAKELEAGLAHSAEEASLLADRMKDALATLRKAHGGPGYLYSLPWYILIGPPGSGKTTALVNSGLKFPLQAGGGPASVEGIGGTRYCDWWFTEDAVLVDTAGRYTTQEADTPADRRAWLDFLGILRRNRPRQPINGALIAVSLEDLLSSSPEELKAHAEAIRSRLLELHEQLKIDFPVYVIFTKADLVAGFSEYFSNLREVDRRAVWGATFQTADRTQNMIGEVPAEFDLLIRRLNERVPDRIQEETEHRARVLIFGFPAQMMALRERLVRFMNDVFEPTRYHANATLRGIYFTSGTQQGTPIDQFLSELSPSHGGALSPLAFSGRGKSFFLTDLINKVILGEAGWGAVNRGVATRARVARGVVYAAMVAVAAVCITLWSISFFENRSLVAAVAKDVNDIRFNAATLLNESSIGDFDFGLIQQQVLDPLRNVPAGYAKGDAPVPWKARMGLSQQEPLNSALEAAYQRVLERMLRPRLILRLEDRLEAIKDDPGAVYDALKVYLMLGGLHKSDDPQILAWLRQDWQQNLYPGPQYAKARERLEQHAAAMLDLDVGTKPLVQLSEPVVSDAQKVLMRMSLADRGYQLLKSDARAGSASDWVLTQRSGPYAVDVFETADGAPLENVIIPGFLTYAGFHTQFLAKLADVESGLAADKWVLGPEADKAAFTDQYATLRRDLQSRYDEEFVRAWTGMLNGLRLKPLTADKQLYSTLSKASGPNSPIRLLLASARDETTLNVERAGVEPELPTPAAPGSGAAAPSGKPAADPAADAAADINSGREVSSRFAQLHALVDGSPGSTPIDAVLAALSGMYDNLMAAKDSPQAQQINADLLKQVAALRTRAMTQLPRPVSNWVLEAANDIDGDVADASIAQLSKIYNEAVGNVCQRLIANRYPFVSNAAQEVQLRDFAQVFQPGGLFDRFFKEHLEPLVDTSGPQWVWRQKGGLSAGLSNESLRQFQRAAEIKQAFFSSGTEPSVSLVVTPAPLSPGTKLAKMKINAAIVESQPGVSMSSAVEWPGAAPDNHVAIVVQSGDTGQHIVQKEKRGPWALFRMLDESTLFRRGDALLATIDVQGQQISYEFSASSVNNPFLLPALHEFRCPSGF